MFTFYGHATSIIELLYCIKILISNNQILVINDSFSDIKKYSGVFLNYKLNFLHQIFEGLKSDNPGHFLAL